MLTPLIFTCLVWKRDRGVENSQTGLFFCFCWQVTMITDMESYHVSSSSTECLHCLLWRVSNSLHTLYIMLKSTLCIALALPQVTSVVSLKLFEFIAVTFSPSPTWYADLMANISMNRYKFPSEEDYDGAITALWRLQATYKLSASTMAQGKLGSSQGLPLTSKCNSLNLLISWTKIVFFQLNSHLLHSEVVAQHCHYLI